MVWTMFVLNLTLSLAGRGSLEVKCGSACENPSERVELMIGLGLWELGATRVDPTDIVSSVSVSGMLWSGPLVLNFSIVESIACSMSAIIDVESISRVNSKFSLVENCSSICYRIIRGTL